MILRQEFWPIMETAESEIREIIDKTWIYDTYAVWYFAPYRIFVILHLKTVICDCREKIYSFCMIFSIMVARSIV